MKQEKIVLIGAGNVAHHLAAALLKAGGNLCQIYSRGAESARELAARTGISYTTDPRQVMPDGDVYLFCVSDDALSPVLRLIRVKDNPLLLHTSGNLPVDVFKPFSRSRGVIYPLQTFSKYRELDFGEIPLFIEGSSPTVLKRVRELSRELSPRVYPTRFEQRKALHLAAVFACNFPNALYQVAARLLERHDLPFSLLRPLIFETAHKVMSMPPAEAQTGPAKRGDENTLARHEKQLRSVDKELLALYTLLSDLVKRETGKPAVTGKTTSETDAGELPGLW
jgi:predicted short-subunit dehydrogenase-like oxidoreductase (DUF2520 family)